MTNETTLPELPEPKYMVTKYRVVGYGDGTMLNPRRGDRVADGLKPAGFTADQMHAYAQQAISEDRAARPAELQYLPSPSADIIDATIREMFNLRAELEQCRADAIGNLREQVIGMQEAAYTFGENCKEAVVVALDGVIEAIDAARGAK